MLRHQRCGGVGQSARKLTYHDVPHDRLHAESRVPARCLRSGSSLHILRIQASRQCEARNARTKPAVRMCLRDSTGKEGHDSADDAHRQNLITHRPSRRDVPSSPLLKRQTPRMQDPHERWRMRETSWEAEFGTGFQLIRPTLCADQFSTCGSLLRSAS